MRAVINIFRKEYIAIPLVIIILAEAISYICLGLMGLNNKSFSEIYDPSGNIARIKGKCEDYAQTLELDPYLGFTHNKDCAASEYRINNVGLLNNDVDFDKGKFYSIGIFGGSVASLYAGWNVTPQLEEILNSCFTSRTGKLFKILNFSDGAWKQPQQAIALLLYGDYVDAAISIEGFNETFTIGSPQDIMAPPGSYISTVNRSFISDLYFKMRYFDQTPLSHSGVIKLFTVLYRRALEKKGMESYLKFNGKYNLPAGADLIAHNTNRYIGFVKSFEAIAASKGIYTMFVLQPAPLHKKLSSYEAARVGSLDYEQKYQIISKILSNAKNFIDLTDLFKDSERTIFSDWIHFVSDSHFKSYGGYKISLEIIDRLARDKEITSKGNGAACLETYEPAIGG